MKTFITITGLKFHFGSKPFAVGQKVKLVKEPDNEYDSEAIKAELPGLAARVMWQTARTRFWATASACGRLYDKIGDSATAKVVLCTGQCGGLQGEDCRERKRCAVNAENDSFI